MRTSAVLAGSFLALVLASAAGCRPELEPSPGAGGGGGGGAGGSGGTSFRLEPEAPADEAPLALRIHVHGGVGEPDDVRFVRGEIGSGHLRQLAADAPSAALEKRILPATVWRDGAALVVAPHALLEPGERYALAIGGHAVFDLTAAGSSEGVLRRVWPPLDAVAALPRAVLCGDRDLPPFRADVHLAPAGLEATVEIGASLGGVAPRCVRVVAPHGAPRGFEGELHLIPPPAIDAGGVRMALDPAPLVVGDAAAPPVAPLACEAPEVRLGPGCAQVHDDRARVRTPDAAHLWVIRAEGADQMAVTEPGAPFVLVGLSPAAIQPLGISVTDPAGREESALLEVQTGAPMPHVVLNEVLADSVGPDAAGEWIELINDGLVAADLGGLRILDAGGETLLPSVLLQPGAFAVVASESWSPDPALDAAPPPGSLVLRVPRLGLHGLSNAGELLRLVDAAGEVLSAVPATRSPGPGTSTARREPWLADAPSSFAPAIATPGAANVLLP